MANKFEKIRVIGSGSFGQAWLVCSRQSKRKYVVKEMQVGNMTEKERNQALNEVSILARLKHHHVIRYRQAYVHHGMLCIAMEYADGGDMGAIIQQSADFKSFLAERRITSWFVQICLALQYIHALNILHRDLKPQNIFVTSDDVVKVGDFGIARILANSNEHANTAIGTPYYLSPEICCRKSYNQKSDMWAAGCILYELATLEHPFDATDFSLLVVKILSAKYKPLNRIYGPFLSDLVSVLLSVNPSGRPSAKQILQIPGIQSYMEKDLNHIVPTDNLNASVSKTRRRQPTSVVPSSESAINKDNQIETSEASQKRRRLLKQSTTYCLDDKPTEDVQHRLTPDNNRNIQDNIVYSDQFTGRKRSSEKSKEHTSNNYRESPVVKTHVKTPGKPHGNPYENKNRQDRPTSDVDLEVSRARNRKYSVNKSGIHLGVTRGTRSDVTRTLTPARVASCFNENDVLYPQYSIDGVGHAMSSAICSCSRTSVMNSTSWKRHKRQSSEWPSDHESHKECNPKHKRKSPRLTPSVSLRKSTPLRKPRNGHNAAAARSRSLCVSLQTPSAGQKRAMMESMHHRVCSSCIDDTVVVVDGNECNVHGDLALSDLQQSDDGEDVVPLCNVNTDADRNLNLPPASGSRHMVKRRHCDDCPNDNDVDTLVDFDNGGSADVNHNHVANYTVEQMYFWARRLAHCDRVDVATLELLRAFLESRVSLLKLKAIRAIFRDGDLYEDDSLMLIIKDILGSQTNVLPLILEVHFMESMLD